MWNRSFIIVLGASFVLSCVSLWRATVGPSSERLMETIYSELSKQPEVIAAITVEGMKTLQRQQDEANMRSKLDKIKAKRQELLGDSKSPFSGNPKGDVTIFSFFDYHCGYCRRVNATLEKLLVNDPNIKIVYKEFPIFGDLTLSKAALAAHKQRRYKDFYTVLMNSEETLSPENLLEIARKLKMNVDQFSRDMSSLEVERQVQENMELGRSLDIAETPTFIVGSNVVPGALDLEGFRQEIAKERLKNTRG